jgi:hypothetical protein
MGVVWIILFLLAEALLIFALMLFLSGTAGRDHRAPEESGSREQLSARSEHDRAG